MSGRFARYALVFYLALALLLSSGRFGSTDAGDQLSAALILVHTGQMGTADPPGAWIEGDVQGKRMRFPDKFFWQAPNGLYYQTHDIGDITVMLPIAFVAAHLSHAPPREQIENPPLIAKVAISLLFSCFGALACWVLFLTFRLFTNNRAAFLLGAGLCVTTFFWPFCKTVWDVSAAGLFASLVLYGCARMLAENRVTTGRIALTMLALVAAAAFRYSFAAFLLLAFGGCLFFVRRQVSVRQVALAAGIFLLGMLPTFTYNHIRMGHFWRPATLIPRYIASGTATLDGNPAVGLFGLLVSPNKGLFWYAPVLLLLLTLPFIWRRLPPAIQQLAITFGGCAVLYTLAISKIPAWSGNIGWGPRYLVPVLPFLYFVAGAVAITLWERHRRLLIALFAVSALVNFPPVFVNWPLALTEYAPAHDQNAFGFYPQEALWRGLGLGLTGQPLPAPPEVLNDPVRRANTRFPDLFAARLAGQGAKGKAGAVVVVLLLGGVAVWAARGLLRDRGAGRGLSRTLQREGLPRDEG